VSHAEKKRFGPYTHCVNEDKLHAES